MKQLYFILSLIGLILFSSCNDWLDVTPRSEVKANVLFSTEDGYKSALTGVYIKLASEELYGRNTTMYFPESLSRHWKVPTITTGTTANDKRNNIINRLGNFDYKYTDVETLINTIWSSYYNSIVQINNILENIETSEVSFRYNNDRLIKGEALGLRAFLHLDILRYFGPIPADNVTLSGKGIPYVTEMTKDPNKLVSRSYQEVLALIEEDLDKAEKLLEIDPILFNSNGELNLTYSTGENIPKDTWQFFRQNRFNYYAVLGTKARFYHWIGNKEKALLYAKKVIEAVNSNQSTKFTLATEANYTTSSALNPSNLTMLTEHLFSLHNPDLQTIIQPLFKDNNANFTQTVALMNTGYENGVHTGDIRYKPSADVNRYWEEVTYQNSVKINHFKKYTGNNLIGTNNLVPLLRLSEMYFITIEDLPLGEAVNYFRTYRIARALDASVDGTLTDNTAVLSRLEKEYRKDFFGEGQMFFFYKKHNYAAYTWPARFTLPSNAYVIPMPNSQIAFE